MLTVDSTLPQRSCSRKYLCVRRCQRCAHLSPPRRLTNSLNRTDWQLPYSAFGETRPTGTITPTTDATLAFALDAATGTRLATTTPPFALNLRFAGQYFDSESNLNYNYFRSYQPTQGRYTQSDPIGLEGGLNRFGYVEGNPLLFTDPLGLQQTPSYTRPSPARDAAGYHDPRGNFVCEKWNCPSNSEMCGRRDLRSPSDFLPAASNPSSAPAGCTCSQQSYRRDWTPPGPDERDLADAYNAYKESQSMSARFRDAFGKLPIWQRIGGYGK